MTTHEEDRTDLSDRAHCDRLEQRSEREQARQIRTSVSLDLESIPIGETGCGIPDFRIQATYPMTDATMSISKSKPREPQSDLYPRHRSKPPLTRSEIVMSPPLLPRRQISRFFGRHRTSHPSMSMRAHSLIAIAAPHLWWKLRAHLAHPPKVPAPTGRGRRRAGDDVEVVARANIVHRRRVRAHERVSSG